MQGDRTVLPVIPPMRGDRVATSFTLPAGGWARPSGRDREGERLQAFSHPRLAGGSAGEAGRGGVAVDDRPHTRNAPETEDETWPIGFMIILTLVVVYLGWRLVQGVGWIIDKL